MEKEKDLSVFWIYSWGRISPTVLIDSGLGKGSQGTVQGMYLKGRAHAMPWVWVPALEKKVKAKKLRDVSMTVSLNSSSNAFAIYF